MLIAQIVQKILESAVIAAVLCADTLAVGFSYGAGKTRIPLRSACVINLICAGVIAIALLAGSWLRNFIPTGAAVWISFAVLFFIGVVKLFDSAIKMLIKRRGSVKFSLFSLNFMLNVYAEPDAADVDGNKTISPGEAALLSLSLSLDGAAVGFGAALDDVLVSAVILCSLLFGFAALALGQMVGRRISKKTKFPLSWLSGAVLIALAFYRLF